MKKFIIALAVSILAFFAIVRAWNQAVLSNGYIGDGLTVLMEQEVETKDGTHRAILMAHRDGTISLSFDGERLMSRKLNLWTEPINRAEEVRQAQLRLSIFDDPWFQGNAELGGGCNRPA